jgi:tRNA(Ile)-lysidine synthase TilS/MesJ
MKSCRFCVLDERFPGIRFEDEDLCNHCRTFFRMQKRWSYERERYQHKFRALVENMRQEKRSSGDGYDLILAYSGGKDSTYTLKLLSEDHGLRVLALTFDHGFLSPGALENIRSVTERLGVDRLAFSPSSSLLLRTFRRSVEVNAYAGKALERASSICNSCMNLAKAFIIRTAIEMGISVVAFGWSPGQAPLRSSYLRMTASMLKKNQEAILRQMMEVMGKDSSRFILTPRHYKLLFERADRSGREGSLLFIHPMAWYDYNEEKIIEELKGIGWRPPQDTDPNSTNCLLNSLANEIHLERYGYHPYAWEVASLVRLGYMTREEGLRRLRERPDPEVVERVRRKLGI